jgi:sugar phosphate permease
MTTTASLRSWQRRIFVTCWLTYASFYLCRVNLSVALPALSDEFAWSKSQAGLIGSALFWAYAVGQFVNGQLGDRVPARWFVGAGLLASGILNVAFGTAASLPLMVILWAANGYVQSMGWGPIVATAARWFDPARRGRLSALLGPSYVLGHAVSWLLAGWLVARFGWRAAFWAPAALVLLSVLHWTVRVRNAPQEVGLAPPNSAANGPASKPAGWSGLWRRTFAHPRLRWPALTNVALGFIMGSAVLWAPTYLVEAAGMDIGSAAVSAVALPLCGLVGVLVAGWASERFFASRIAPVALLLLLGLAASVLALRFLAPLGGTALAVALLGLIGATGQGAGSLLVTVVALSLSGDGRVSSAAGFLNFASYVGSGLGGLLAALLVESWGWDAMFAFWAGMALLGIATMLPTWRVERKGLAAGTAGQRDDPALAEADASCTQ